MGYRSRSKSEFDPDELAKITHRGLHSLSRANEPRVTQTELKTLKSTQENEKKVGVKAMRHLQRLLRGVSAGIKGLFVRPQKKVLQCENYGHVLRQGWSGPYPICVDCGVQITNMSMIRGASPKGNDEQTESGRWKRVH